MKTLKYITTGITAVMVLILIQACSVGAQAPKGDKKNAVKSMVDSKDYVFKADYVIPMRGTSRSLTSDYDLAVSKDTVKAYLPFFGRAYTAPMDPTQGGIKFTSTDFDYQTKEKKKGGWQVTIEPKDAADVRQLMLDISENGYASLRVTSNNREAISFNGYIKERSK